jgi:hypothetical protein
MRATIFSALLAVAVSAYASDARTQSSCPVEPGARWSKKQREWLDDAGRTWSNDTLRTALLRAAGLNGSGVQPLQLGFELEGDAPAVTSQDSAAIAQLRALASTRGSTWPVKSVVGAAGVRAVWTLAHRDTALARAALKRMMEAGPEESHAADVATLEDHLRLLSGRKQLYGTQFRFAAGAIALAPIEDSAHVDLRREDAGLPPFGISACLAKASIARRR